MDAFGTGMRVVEKRHYRNPAPNTGTKSSHPMSSVTSGLKRRWLHSVGKCTWFGSVRQRTRLNFESACLGCLR